MSFSPRQQPEFRTLVKAAWQVHCRAEGMNPEAKTPERAWYEGELFAATGKYSTKECGGGRDYDLAMAHFEVLAGDGIKWQMRLFGGDARRIIHQLGEISAEHDLDEQYLRGVARRMLKTEVLPELHQMPREVLVSILGEVKRHVRRRLKREKVEAPHANAPF